MLRTPIANLKVNAALVHAVVEGLRVLNRLPHELWTASTSRDITVSKSARSEYEEVIRTARQAVKENAPNEQWCMSTHNLLVAHRLLWLATGALSQDLTVFIGIGLLQFVVAPYSLAVSLSASAMYFATMCLGHYCTAALLSIAPLPDWTFELSYTFMAAFLLVDFLISCRYAFVPTVDGAPKRFPLGKTLHHMAYGTLNSKSYVLLVFLACRGTRINLAWLLLDALLGVGAFVNNMVQNSVVAWEVMFYHIHRIGHLPLVYEHAHRAHHHLTDCMAFDGHIFSGSGFPEELPLLLHDILLIRGLGVPPPFLTYRMLSYQLANKDGHQRRDDSCELEQYHQDHHALHRANYGAGRPMLDLLFDTYRRVGGEQVKDVTVGDATFSVEESQDHVTLKMQLSGPSYFAWTCQPLPAWQKVLERKLRTLLKAASP